MSVESIIHSARVNESNIKLDPENILKTYNGKVAKYHQKEEISSHDVLELSELSKAINSPELKFPDKDFLLKVQKPEVKESQERLADEALAYLEDSMSYDRNLGQKPLTSNSIRARLRRTAGILVKATLIPKQSLEEGAFKIVKGPLGIGSNTQRDRAQAIFGEIGLISSWDGNFSSALSQDRQTSEKQNLQLVRIASKQEDGNPELVLDENLKIEMELIKDLKHKLPGATFLPVVRGKGNNSILVEYIPHKYEHDEITESIAKANELTTIVKDLWEIGIIHGDLKPGNLRERSNGQIVLLDWGIVSNIEPGATWMTPEDIKGGTFTFTPPEVTIVENTTYEVEPLLSFHLGAVLLADLYPNKDINKALLDKKGYHWPYVVERGNQKLEYSINSSTLEALRENAPDIKLPDDLYDLLSRMLDNSPENRPGLDEIQKTLSTF